MKANCGRTFSVTMSQLYRLTLHLPTALFQMFSLWKIWNLIQSCHLLRDSTCISLCFMKFSVLNKQYPCQVSKLAVQLINQFKAKKQIPVWILEVYRFRATKPCSMRDCTSEKNWSFCPILFGISLSTYGHMPSVVYSFSTDSLCFLFGLKISCNKC